jgi:hypothetical protein
MFDVFVRTTLTLEDEVAHLLKQRAGLQGQSFKEVVNTALRQGLGLEEPSKREKFRVVAHSSPFQPGIDPGKLNQLVDELEAEAFRKKGLAK